MDLPQTRQNNFDFLRLLAAILVVFGHSFDLNGRGDTPLAWLTNHQTAEHGVGVMIFFAISGYLICRSFVNSDNLKRFVTARLLRIVPGLAVAVLLTVFVLGPLVTSLPAADYFSHKQTWQYLQNIFPWSVKYQLPGVFPQNAHGPNGSLWTLPLELRCYAAVLLLGACRILKIRSLLWFAYIAALVFYWQLAPGQAATKAELYIAFFTGAMLYLNKDRLPHRWPFALGCLAALCIADYLGLLLKALPIAGPYLMIYLAYSEKLKLYRLTSYGDFSYGIYVYAFPIQQLLIHLNGGSMHPMATFFGALPLVLICAVLSWFLIEKPALAYKKK